MRAYILRSRSYPLCVDIKHPGQEDVLSDAVVFRLKSLALNLPVANLVRPLGRLISPTPMLEDLTITVTDSGDYLPTLKAGDFMLTKLHLDGVSPNLAYLTIPHLATLHLENLRDSPRMPDLLQFLERTPWLEELSLVDAGPEEDGEPPDRVVRLRSLRALTLRGTVVKAKLLQHLALPASADINLMGRFNQHFNGLMQEFLPPCLDNLPVTSNFTSLSVTSTSRSSCEIDFSGQEGKLSITVKNRGVLGLGPLAANLCLQRFTPLVLGTVTHLTLQRHSWGQQVFPEAPTFCEFLHQFPSLQSINLVHCDFNSISALNPVGVNLPFFRSLTIYVAPDAKIDLDLLSSIAESKSLLRSPLERVKLVFGTATRTMFMESEMDRLKEHVQVVEVEEIDENNITRVF